MELAASRRIRQHFNATQHFRAACRTAYNDVLSHTAATGVGPHALYIAVVRVHDVLGSSLHGYRRRAPITPSWGQFYRAFRTRRVRYLLSVVGIRGPDLAEEIVVNEAEFEEFALDVIAGEAWSYLKWDLWNRIFLMGVVTCIVAAVGNRDRHVYLAVMFSAYCVYMATLTFSAVRYRDNFFLV